LKSTNIYVMMKIKYGRLYIQS